MDRKVLTEVLGGKTIREVKSKAAWGMSENEFDDVLIIFTDGTGLRLHAVGPEADGIGFVVVPRFDE